MFRVASCFSVISCALAGCGALGNSDYGCKGMPDGARCLSTLEVYAATEHADAVHATDEHGTTSEQVSPDASDRPASPRIAGTSASPSGQPATGTFLPQQELPAEGQLPVQGAPSAVDIAGLVPATDVPVPVRMPAQVMRIWFAPWEDASGDLTVSTIVFTEIVSRRWVIGDAYTPVSAALSPLEPPSTP
jgi:conjugal transfer pilus assembly protein TraV